MTPRALYLLGAPGAGKSTLMAAVLGPTQLGPPEVLHPHYPMVKGQRFTMRDGRSGVHLGGPHPRFPGTDRLSMGVYPHALRWVAGEVLPDVVLGEGARLGTVGFLHTLAARAALTVIWLDPPPIVMAARRQGRSNTEQNPAWVKGAGTRAAVAAAACAEQDIPVWRITDPAPEVGDLAQLARTLLAQPA